MEKRKINFIIITLVMLISVVGVSYAFFEYYKLGSNNRLIFGNIYLELNEAVKTAFFIDFSPISFDIKPTVKSSQANKCANI